MKITLITFLYCLLFTVSYGQNTYQSSIVLNKDSGKYSLTLIFVAYRPDSVSAFVSTNPYQKSANYQNTIPVNLSKISNPVTFANNFLWAIYNYDYGKANHSPDTISCSNSASCPVTAPPQTASTDSAWLAFMNQFEYVVSNRINDIQRDFLNLSKQEGLIQIAETSGRIRPFGYTIQKGSQNQIQFSLIDDFADRSSTKSGINNFITLYGNSTQDISDQIFNIILNADSTTVSPDKDAFYKQNLSSLNNISLIISKLKGTYLDLNTIPERHGFIRINNNIPLYIAVPDSAINYENLVKTINKNAGDSLLIKKYPFLPYRWKFVVTDTDNPHKGLFYLRKDINSDTYNADIHFSVPINLDDIKKPFYTVNRQISKIEIDSVDVVLVDGEIVSFGFYIKNGSGFPNISRFQYFNIRYPLRVLSKSKYSFFHSPYLYLQNKEHQKDLTYLIHPSDIIFFDHPDNLSDVAFTSIDTVFRFRSTNNQINSTQQLREKDVFSIFRLDLFGDISGFLSDGKPNGLIQSELNFNTFLFRKPVNPENITGGKLYFFNDLNVRARYSKIDNKNKYLDILKTTDTLGASTKYLHAFNLYLYQNYILDLSLNVVKFDFESGSVNLYVKGGILSSNLRDTVYTTDGSTVNKSPYTFGLNSLKYSLGLMFKFLRTHDINVDFDAEGLVLKPTSKSFQLSKSEYNQNDLAANKFTSYSNQSLLLDPKIIVTVNLDPGRTKRLIVRGEWLAEAKQLANNALFLHVGYSADLNRFINLAKPGNANY